VTSTLPRVLMISKAIIVGIYQRKLELMAAQGIDLLALAPASWRDERGEVTLEHAFTSGYRLETLPLRFNGSYHLHLYAGLNRAIRSFQPHIVHIDEEPYNAAAWQMLYLARRAGAKTLFFTWQNIARRYPPPFSWGERWIMRQVDYAIAGTQSAGDVLRVKGYRKPLAVIPQFGVDPDLFVPAEMRPDGPYRIGFIGRLVEEKGVRVLLEACAALTGDWQLTLIGGGPLADDLRAQAARLRLLDRVTFAGQIPSAQMPAHIRRFDVVALPSLTRPNWKEQFGRALIEAMSSGVPVIGSDSGAIPDVIGAVGLIVPEGDPLALKGALIQIRDDRTLAESLRKKGRARVLAHYTHAQIAAQTVAVYRAMLE